MCLWHYFVWAKSPSRSITASGIFSPMDGKGVQDSNGSGVLLVYCCYVVLEHILFDAERIEGNVHRSSRDCGLRRGASVFPRIVYAWRQNLRVPGRSNEIVNFREL